MNEEGEAYPLVVKACSDIPLPCRPSIYIRQMGYSLSEEQP